MVHKRTDARVKTSRQPGCLVRAVGLFFKLVMAVALVAALLTVGPNLLMYASNAFDIKTVQQMEAEESSFDADAILVLGAAVKADGTPSDILRDRLDTAIELYQNGVAPKIIMSGDNSDSHYNEVMHMCEYAVSKGVARDDIFCDHAGIDTYDSMYRAYHVFGVSRLVVVTNQYHLYRAMYLAKSYGVSTRGVASDKGNYDDMNSYETREFLARIKDFYSDIMNVEPSTYSAPVSLSGSGTVTQWWKKSS